MPETQSVEYKQGWRDEYLKWICGFANAKEVDFIVRKGHTVMQLIQVCHSIANSKTMKRKTDALTETASELDCRNLLLITWDREETIEKNGKEIKIVPAWQWMINYVPDPAAN